MEQPKVDPTPEESESASLATEQPASVSPVVNMKLEKIVPMNSATIFYFSIHMEDKDPLLISIMPVTVYVIDSRGQKIQLIGNYTW